MCLLVLEYNELKSMPILLNKSNLLVLGCLFKSKILKRFFFNGWTGLNKDKPCFQTNKSRHRIECRKHKGKCKDMDDCQDFATKP